MAPTVEDFCNHVGAKPLFESREEQERWSYEFHLDCLEACNKNFPRGRYTAMIRAGRPKYKGPSRKEIQRDQELMHETLWHVIGT